MESFEHFVIRLGRHMFDLLERESKAGYDLAEYSEDEESVSLVLDMSGVSAENIRVYISQRRLKVYVLGFEGAIYDRVFSSGSVNPQKAEITFVNGVLSLRIRRI
jgi:HSP20 family molecular chaperone IbpA